MNFAQGGIASVTGTPPAVIGSAGVERVLDAVDAQRSRALLPPATEPSVPIARPSGE